MGIAIALRGLVFGLGIVVCAGAQEAAEGLAIQGVVVDSQGKPVSDAQLGTGWWFDYDGLRACGGQYVWPALATRKANDWSFVPTELDGSFDARVLPRHGKVQLTIFSRDREQSGTFVWDEKEDLSDLKLRLEPVARLRATTICTDLGKREVPVLCYLRSVDGRRLGRFKAARGIIDLRLPAGHYTLHLYGGQEIGSRNFSFMVTAGEDAKAGDIDIPANHLLLQRGRKMPPWHVSEARGIKLAEATMAHFRGKWLLVAVWQYNGNRPSRLFPLLLNFDRKWRDKHPNEEPPYAIVLLHTGAAKSLGDLDAKIEEAGLRKKHWGGRALPFPILIDPDRKTAKSWKLRWNCQTMLFDPEGRLWGETVRALELNQIVAGTMKPALPVKLAIKKPKPKPLTEPVRRKRGK